MEVAFNFNLEADFPLIGEGNSNPLQYSCLENSMDRGAWQATVLRVAKSRTRLILSLPTYSCPKCHG